MTTQSPSPVEQIISSRIVAIVRLDDYARALEVAHALLGGGIDVLEFTLTGKGAVEAVSAARHKLSNRACIGAGTVLTADDARSVIDAGARFVVTPAVRKDVISLCLNRNTPVVCGGFTPTELLDAHESGCELVKLFPARSAGPQYVRDVLAPLPFLKLVPTGGVNAENARAYLDAGAVAVGIGGNLVPREAVVSGDFERITSVARACVAAVSR